jgi:hypothetical protein
MKMWDDAQNRKYRKYAKNIQRKNKLFLLPASTEENAIDIGQGYHKLEPITDATPHHTYYIILKLEWEPAETSLYRHPLSETKWIC